MSILIDLSQSSPVISGCVDQYQEHIINDSEINAFGLNDHAKIKKEIAQVMGAEPKYIWYRNPTEPCDRPNMYTDYGWKQVTAHLTFVYGKVVSTSRKPVSLVKVLHKNESNKPVTYTARLSKSVSKSVTHSTSHTNTWSGTLSTKVTIIPDVWEVGASFTYEHKWDETTQKSESVTISCEAGTSIELQPGESVEVELVCEEVIPKIELYYDAFLSGGVAMEYGYWYKNHRKYYVTSVINNKRKRITETVDFKAYDNWKIIVRSPNASDNSNYKNTDALGDTNSNNILEEVVVNPAIIPAPDENSESELTSKWIID